MRQESSNFSPLPPPSTTISVPGSWTEIRKAVIARPPSVPPVPATHTSSTVVVHLTPCVLAIPWTTDRSKVAGGGLVVRHRLTRRFAATPASIFLNGLRRPPPPQEKKPPDDASQFSTMGRPGRSTGVSLAAAAQAAGGSDGIQPIIEDVVEERPTSKDQPDVVLRTAAFRRNSAEQAKTAIEKMKHWALTFSKFIGPGFMISVAYIDPGNYATDIAAGASYQYKLLFVVLLSNLFAILLQSLAIQLGTITGLDLSSMCRVYLPRWLNYTLYALAEIAIIATDLAEVIGTAIALNLLIPKLPLVAGCALSILDVMAILFFYRPDGSMKGLRLFEAFVCLLVLGVVICFCIELSMIKETSVGTVFKGYLPSSALVESEGLYQACGILGATVMPHSLFLGSGIVQPRLREYDTRHGLMPQEPVSAASSTSDGYDKPTYLPSHAAIKHSLKYSITELGLSLFTFALFVNSAILIVAGASLYQNPDALDADIFGIHDLLSKSISPAVGTIFALALLLSGISAGIVCTIAGQMVSEERCAGS
ncbi:hypothetical protein ACCO45_009253 [Purpureocillium lilacinum]|uniref:Uncharacterized protein n=1 Tax=Purpureocillium lilacinum TaxID=33203 RepID=A0ACC4DJ71_PURLI